MHIASGGMRGAPGKICVFHFSLPLEAIAKFWLAARSIFFRLVAY